MSTAAIARQRTRSVPLVAVIGLAAIAVYVGVVIALADLRLGEHATAALVAPVLVAVTLPALRRESIRERDPSLFALLALALVLKLLGGVARYFITFSLYADAADANAYHTAGAQLAGRFRRFDFALDGVVGGEGTRFVKGVVGGLYAVIGPSKMAGFILFSWLGFLGLFFLYRAFVIAVPAGRIRSYSHLVFFLPSLLYWPSSLGKEALMLFALGLAALGVSLLVMHRVRGALLPCLLGGWLLFEVRPHLAAMVAVATVIALLVQRTREEHRELAPVVKTLSLVAALVVALFLVRGADRYLQSSGLETTSVSTALDDLTARTAQGGSEFHVSVLDNPANAPIAAGTVLFRPFPTEAKNAQALVAALEGSFLLVFAALRWRSLVLALRSLRESPYVAFAATFCVLFIIGFSAVANFGILTRQRVQIYPLFFVLLCLIDLKPARDGTR